jgi:hypothetical protein
MLTALTALPWLVLAALLLAGLALSAALLLLTGLLAALLVLRLLAALLRVALLRIALLLLIAPRIVLLLVRHGTLSSDFRGLAPPPAQTTTRERRLGSALSCHTYVQRIEIFGKTGPPRGRGVAARTHPC